MKKNTYYYVGLLLATVVSPILLSATILAGNYAFYFSVITAVPWHFFAKKAKLQDNLSDLLLPLLHGFGYYLLLWIIFFALAGYDYQGIYGVFYILTIPFTFFGMIMSIIGFSSYFPVAVIVLLVLAVLTLIITKYLCKQTINFDRKGIWYLVFLGLLVSISAYQLLDRNSIYITFDDSTRINEEVSYLLYQPFAHNNKLIGLDEPPTITFDSDYPRLDGATAAFPVYAGIAQELYSGLDEQSVNDYVTCTTTSIAYERLINAEVDIFFGALPSQDQVALAAAQGKEFDLLPIAKEAFVFIVNKDNPVDSLTIEQIQAIYQRKITNWSQLGGNNQKILAFQRPEGSGSQSVMSATVMKNRPMTRPLKEEFQYGMGATVSCVASYQNQAAAIGYSFRYFVTGMKLNADVKLLAINGIEPTTENIRSGSYPLTVDVYAVTISDRTENTEKLLQWLLSPQGQNYLELCGYVQR